MISNKVNTIEGLSKKLDALYGDIYSICEKCQEEDCHGFIWLMPEEAEKAIKKNISVIEINEESNFIDSFARDDKNINTETLMQRCVLRANCGKCSVYRDRPVVCRLYPLSFRVLRKQTYLVLQRDCLFVQDLVKNQKIDNFIDRAVRLFYNINSDLLRKICETYKQVNYICKHPKNYRHNDIKILKIQLKPKYVKMQSASGF